MANRKRNPKKPHAIILNRTTRSFLADQGRVAEMTFQAIREDKLPPLSTSDESWKQLLHDLSDSCRTAGELFAKYKTILSSDSPRQKKEVDAKQDPTGFEGNTGRQARELDFSDLLDASTSFWNAAERSVGGMDIGLELFARYFDLMRKRLPGRRPDIALDILIHGKYIAWLARHEFKNNRRQKKPPRRQRGFLNEMQQTLQELGYPFQSRAALAQRIKTAKRSIVVYRSKREAAAAAMRQYQHVMHSLGTRE